jgi:ankyrin repeat protein
VPRKLSRQTKALYEGEGKKLLVEGQQQFVAALNAVDTRRHSALHYAAANGNVIVVRILLDARADPNAFSAGGELAVDVSANHVVRSTILPMTTALSKAMKELEKKAKKDARAAAAGRPVRGDSRGAGRSSSFSADGGGRRSTSSSKSKSSSGSRGRQKGSRRSGGGQESEDEDDGHDAAAEQDRLASLKLLVQANPR